MNNHHEDALEEGGSNAILHLGKDNGYEKELEEAGSSIPSEEQNGEVKKLRLWQILTLCSIGLAQEFIDEVEAGYTVPLLVASGLPIQFTSLLWGVVGILAILLQPVSSISDSCTWSWGRRRPFIILFSISAIICLVVAPNMLYVVSPRLIATIVACTSIAILDLSTTMLMTMSQAYFIDVVPISQNLLASFTYQMISGVGILVGDLLGGIPWSRIFGNTVTIQNQTQIVFTSIALMTIVCMFLTIFSVKEKVVQSEEVLESCSGELIIILKQHWCFKWIAGPYFDIIQFLYYMSFHMWLTFLYTITSAAVYQSYAVYFTVFMATVVYGGAQSCPVDSECYQNYVTGVRVGCLGLALADATNILFSLSLNWITKRLKLKTVYLIVLTVFTIATAVMSIFHQLPLVLILGMPYGPVFGLAMYMPFEMVPVYMVSVV